MTEFDLTKLNRLGARYERERAAAENTRAELVPEILAAVAADVPQVEIVKASRLTRERIRQIVNASRAGRG